MLEKLLTYFFNGMKRLFGSIFDRLSFLQAAEVTVISFVIMSFVGAGILYYTEQDRMVTAKVPVLNVVTINPSPSEDINLSNKAHEETHTFTKDVTYKGETFIDSLFTAVSALCVTGLISTDFSKFTWQGQFVTLILIQMGGLGILLFTSIFAIAIVQGLSESRSFRSILSGVLDTSSKSVIRLLRHVAIYTVLFEGLGTIIMGTHLQFSDPSIIGGLNPWWWAVFHSVSAFNNAGFGLLNNNLVNFVTDPVINLTIATLIILGGLGYPVLIAMHARLGKFFFGFINKVGRSLDDDVKEVVASSIQTKIAISGTIIFLALGTALPLILDWNNPTLANYSVFQKIMIAFFQSTSTRTAGFNTIDIGALATGTTVLFMMLMFIGANPAGTAGGIKIPTVAVLYGYVKDWFMAPGQAVVLSGQKISKFAVSHAIRLTFSSVLFLMVVTMLIVIAENKYLGTPDPTINLHKIIFEIISAFGTVGMSMGFAGGVTSLSAILTSFSKTMIIIVMLFGRLGALTILAALPWKRRYSEHPLSEDFPGAQKIQIG